MKPLSSISSINKKVSRTYNRVSEYLESETSSGQFNERSYYGEAFFAAALAINENSSTLQHQLIAACSQKNWNADQAHHEFNYYALQRVQEFHSLENEILEKHLREMTFPTIFLRKVTNWVLLRSLVRIQSGQYGNKIIAHIQARIVMQLNTHSGFITDNTLRMYHTRTKSVSLQYHLFAAYLIGKLYLLTGHTFYRRHFLAAVENALPLIQTDGSLAAHGRGSHQLFGYASAILCLTQYYKMTKNVSILKKLESVLDYVTSFQEDNGSIPLLLMQKDENTEALLYSYNNTFDYLPFYLFALAEIKNELSPAK